MKPGLIKALGVAFAVIPAMYVVSVILDKIITKEGD